MITTTGNILLYSFTVSAGAQAGDETEKSRDMVY